MGREKQESSTVGVVLCSFVAKNLNVNHAISQQRAHITLSLLHIKPKPWVSTFFKLAIQMQRKSSDR